MNEKIQLKKLPNGLEILLVPQKESRTVTVLILVGAGSDYETKRISGISHFLEHMSFKGTRRRPRPIDIVSELDSIGAQYNAFTYREYTCYYAKAETHQFKKILDVIADIYLNSVFPKTEIEKERGVILEEIRMYQDNPARYVWDLFFELMYGDQPAGWNITGDKESVERLQREDILNYYHRYYNIPNTLIVVAGNFDNKEVLAGIKKMFADIKRGRKSKKKITKESQSKPEIKTLFKKTEQTHLILGTRSFNIFDPKKYPLEILAGILGGGMSSRLFQRLREKMGVAYYVGAGATLFSDRGFLAARAGINNSRFDEVIKVLLEEFRKITDFLVSPKELERVKEQIRGALVMELETSDELASFYGVQKLILDKILTPEEIFAKIEKVKPEDVQKVAQEIFLPKNLNLAVIGPIKKKIRLEKFL